MIAALLILMWLRPAEDRLPDPPLGLDLYMPVPEINVLTREKVELGRRLFFDKMPSADETVTCATCHLPERGFADGAVYARREPRNARRCG